MYQYKCKVLRVVDGDTVDVLVDLGFDIHVKQRVRMFGIDTPESRTRDLEEKKYGKLATEFLKSLMPVGEILFVSTALDNKGKFGRVLGTFYSTESEPSFNQQIVMSHIGVVYYGQSKDDIQAEHIANRILLKAKGVVVE
jgi:micrococcal nuclease